MPYSIFTRIIKGEVPCHKVFEDEQTFAFMDIHPVQPGMVLVVTKRQAEEFTDLTDDELVALMKTVKKIALKLKQVFPDKKRVGIQIEGLDVDHVHVKVFPINTGDEFRALPSAAEPDHAALAEIAKRFYP